MKMPWRQGEPSARKHPLHERHASSRLVFESASVCSEESDRSTGREPRFLALAHLANRIDRFGNALVWGITGGAAADRRPRSPRLIV